MAVAWAFEKVDGSNGFSYGGLKTLMEEDQRYPTYTSLGISLLS